MLAPCSGRVIAITDVPDPVFAQEMVGPGVAIEPDAGPTTVVSPIAGKVIKVMPHAFVILGDGVGVLVHLGINTVRLEGEGFEVIAVQGSEVAAGDPMISWDPATLPSSAGGQDVSPVVPVVLMDGAKGSVASEAIGGAVGVGDLLFVGP
ncbi:PTS glucose transporter subunit IIA [Epidermidibacterium keratini]|uniref:PTS glucose transporter subunit IIA n=1 Tax=Epidermidibacterium keratini TaxID=1891644 RepID=A0A7L4YT97_9ACTN|nr:PTS glucose transporter subunit IIA [Epidermidibacterium keratini]